MLLERGLLPEPALYLSAYFERYRSTYYDLLLKVSQEGAWEAWLVFFLEGVRSEAKDAVEKAQSLITLRERWREQYQREGGSAHLPALVDLLFEQPVLTVPRIANRLDITPAWANRLVNRLVQDGILEPMGARRRNRVFAARAILDTLEA
ncbi:MAG: hypothetical protein ABDH20_06190 [Thermus sp.]